MTRKPEHEETAADQSTASGRRDGVIREALEHDQDQAEGTIDSERRDARQTQDQVDIQRRDARETQERIDVQADIQRRDAREAQERIDVQADTQRRDAHDAQERIDVQADIQRRGARTAQDQAEAAQDTERRDALDLFDARREGERREAFERNVTDQQRAGDLEQANRGSGGLRVLGLPRPACSAAGHGRLHRGAAGGLRACSRRGGPGIRRADPGRQPADDRVHRRSAASGPALPGRNSPAAGRSGSRGRRHRRGAPVRHRRAPRRVHHPAALLGHG